MIGIRTRPGRVQKREKTDRKKTVYANSNNILQSKHASSNILKTSKKTPPLPPLPQTIGMHHLVVSPCCIDQAIAFLVLGGYTFHTGNFLRLQTYGDCCPTVSFSLIFLFKRKTLLLKLTCAEPGTNIHCRAVRKGWSIVIFFLTRSATRCSLSAMLWQCLLIAQSWKKNPYIRVFMCRSTPCLLTTSLSSLKASIKRFHRKYKSQYLEMDHREKCSVYTLFGLARLSIISTGPCGIQPEPNFLITQRNSGFQAPAWSIFT